MKTKTSLPYQEILSERCKSSRFLPERIEIFLLSLPICGKAAEINTSTVEKEQKTAEKPEEIQIRLRDCSYVIPGTALTLFRDCSYVKGVLFPGLLLRYSLITIVVK